MVVTPAEKKLVRHLKRGDIIIYKGHPKKILNVAQKFNIGEHEDSKSILLENNKVICYLSNYTIQTYKE